MKRVIFLVLAAFLIGQLAGQETGFYLHGIYYPHEAERNITERTKSGNCDTIYSFPTADLTSGIAFHEENVWYSTPSYLYKSDITGVLLDSIVNPNIDDPGVGPGTGGVAIDGDILMFIAEQFGKLYKIDLNSGNIIDVIELPSFGDDDPNINALAVGDGFLWFMDYFLKIVYKADLEAGGIIDSFEIEEGLIFFEWKEGYLYGVGSGFDFVVNGGPQYLYKLDVQEESITDSLVWCVPRGTGITINDDITWGASGNILEMGTERIHRVDFEILSTEFGNEHSEFSLNVYPNPANNNIWIDAGILENANIYIHNSQGHLINAYPYKSGNARVNIGHLTKGIYFIVVSNERINLRTRLIHF